MGRDVQATRLWDRVTDAGRKATVMNVPVTFPPQRNVQRMVSGFLSPSVDKAAYPDDFRDHLRTGYIIDVNAKLGHKDDKTEFVENANKTLDRRFEAFSHYLQQDDWDLFFGVFMTTDRVNHFLFKDYERDVENKRRSLSSTASRRVSRRPARPAPRRRDDAFSPRTTASPRSLRGPLQRVPSGGGVARLRDDDHEQLEDISDDTLAYSLIPGRFYINLEGREPRGAVPQDEYERRDELKEMLEALEGPDGKHRRRPCRHQGRRLPRRPRRHRTGPHCRPEPRLRPEVRIQGHRRRVRRRAAKRDAQLRQRVARRRRPGRRIDDADLYDIAPTILDLMDVDFDRPTSTA